LQQGYVNLEDDNSLATLAVIIFMITNFRVIFGDFSKLNTRDN